MISGPPQAPNEAATFIQACATADRQFLDTYYHTALEMLTYSASTSSAKSHWGQHMPKAR
jgi:hypothetical protein